MLISRDNYEEFFLLYADNELSATERSAVEEFVQLNPDLAVELQMLKQSTLQQERMVFEQKEALYKQENGISIDNYEEHFLLAVDNELDEEQNAEVERFALKHPELKDEFILLKKTKLQPERIEFAGRESLYRKEKQRRVIAITWARISAAAAVISIAVLSWFLFNDNENIKTAPLATINNSGKTVVKKAKVIVPKAEVEQPAVAADETTLATADIRKERVIARKTGKEKRGHDVVVAEKVIKHEAHPIEEKQSNNVAITQQPLPEQKFNEPSITINSPGKEIEVARNESIKPSLAKYDNPSENSSLITHPVYLNIDDENDDKTIYVGVAEINRNKLKGLFKKASRLFEKKNDKEGQQRTIEIAGFEIKTK